MLPQKVLINVGINAFASANEDNGTFLAIAAHHSENHLLERSLRFGQDANAGVHVGPQGGPSSSCCGG